ncbi:ATP-binding protein [Nonomuraea sp. NPDC050556]|uniref:ATP-binding protein n=1 Tax=Nonomuraea sp. NPDC050556 TaxID=3364369 RepID=UPI00379BB293
MSTEPVSPREAEVMALLDEHLSNVQIAGRLGISVRTVENHVSSLLRKYGVADRRALAAIARRRERAPARVSGPPTWRTGFVGRAHERDAVQAMLQPGRLVTLTGPGGVGKTRLAASVAPDAAFVDLVPVREGQVTRAVATALGLGEQAGLSLEETVASALGSERHVLVLDNCEHVLDSVASLADRILAACPGATLLTTSRERLGLPGEHVVPISPLPLSSDAEALFADRARTADPGFSAPSAVVAEICARLDGMPLAIELAAARCASLGADGLLAALDDSLRLLAGGRHADERHRSLRAVIGWSHALLDPDERALFPRLAVFSGPFDLTATRAIAPNLSGPDVLGRLVDKSLVVREARGWRLLETVRAYAFDQLGEDLDEVRHLHLRWAVSAAESTTWGADLDDLRAALRNAPPGPGELPHRLARELGRLTYARRLVTEALEHFTEAARRATTAGEAAEDLRTASQAVYAVGLAHRSYDLLLEAADQAKIAGDRQAQAVALAQAVVTAHRFASGFPNPIPPQRLTDLLDQATALATPEVAAHLAAARACHTREPALADAAVEAARATGDPLLLCAALDGPGTLALRAGRFGEAHRIATERLTLLDLVDRRHPAAAAEILDCYHVAWLCALGAGDLQAALRTAEEIAGDDLLGAHPYRSAAKLIVPLVLLGRFDEALEQAAPMWQAWQNSGAPVAAWLAPAASAVALVHGLRGDDAAFRQWRARARAAAGPKSTAPSETFAAFVDARVALATGDFAHAATLVARASAGEPTSWSAAYARTAAAELAAAAGLG